MELAVCTNFSQECVYIGWSCGGESTTSVFFQIISSIQWVGAQETGRSVYNLSCQLISFQQMIFPCNLGAVFLLMYVKCQTFVV